jgi:two-component system OmpR family sensor kinase
MAKHLSLHGLRARLALAISLISVAVVGGSFVAIHQGTGSELERRIDSDLKEQAAEFRQGLTEVSTPADLERAAKKYVASQQYHPESRIFVVTVRGGKTVTNQQDVISREELLEKAERTEGGGEETDRTLLDAPDGSANVPTEDAGNLRVLSRPILEGGQRIGTFRVADPRLPIERAQAGLRYTFLVVGVVALVVSFAVAFWVASLITRPLRRMARVATEVDAGDLTHRIGNVGTSDEVSMLADSFDHMLDRLEAAFKRQREFVSDASHELRTPLTVLRGQIELLARGGVEASQREETTQTLLRELDRMNRLVDDMLMLARAEAGEMVERRAVDLGDFLEDLERDLPLFGDRDYRVQGTRSGTLSVDPDRLSQVFRNLVRNAVGHTKRGDRITVSTTTSDGRIRFAVSDSGPGIPEQQLERIFDRFYRTDAGRDRDRGGSGLGLPIARAIVEAHGGSIKADRSPEGGAAITFELPGYRSKAGGA